MHLSRECLLRWIGYRPLVMESLKIVPLALQCFFRCCLPPVFITDMSWPIRPLGGAEWCNRAEGEAFETKKRRRLWLNSGWVSDGYPVEIWRKQVYHSLLSSFNPVMLDFLVAGFWGSSERSSFCGSARELAEISGRNAGHVGSDGCHGG